jgi:DNA-binding response OmpR family regulator
MGKKIVLADDDELIAKAYKDGLTRAGYDVIVAHNGEEAIHKIRSEKPHLILLDLIMPKINGFKVLKMIKADSQLQSIPVIALSNLDQPSDVSDIYQLGGVDYMVKAELSLDRLLKHIDNTLKKSVS